MVSSIHDADCGGGRPGGSVSAMFMKVCKFFSTFAYVLLLVVLIRGFVFQTYHIPSGSMMNTLLDGDYIFVTKYNYGFGTYALPFRIPGWHSKIFASVPKAGDVVVFRPFRHPDVNYVKRVIGLPGDKVQIIKGVLFINGKEMRRKELDDFYVSEDGSLPVRFVHYRESLYNGTSHEVLDTGSGDSALDNTPVYVVPDASVFVLGDNRSRSRDSRFLSDVGFVPLTNVLGKVQVVLLSFEKVSAGSSSNFSLFGYRLRDGRVFHEVV